MERRGASDDRADTGRGNHYPCSMSAMLIGEVHEFGGADAVGELMKLSGTRRTFEYLTDISNWISYDEAVALWRAGSQVTHNPHFPRKVGERAAERLASSPVAGMLRSLGSPEQLYRQIATSASKFSTVVRMEAVEVEEKSAVLTCEAVPGCTRAAEHCAWTVGLLAAAPILYLLAVRFEPGGRAHRHQRGFEQHELAAHVERLLDVRETDFPQSWLVVPVRSDRRSYGRLVAAFDEGTSFFPEERELLEIFASYAASALDGAVAVNEAKRRYDQSSALLKLARALASAGTSTEIAQRLSEAVPLVVDCDRVGVYLWDPAVKELVRRSFTSKDPDDPMLREEWRQAPSPGGPVDQLLAAP